MVATLEEARALCEVPLEAEALDDLAAVPDCAARRAAETGRRGGRASSHTLGVMLPYTPLHHILLRDVGRPLVMTSGNLSEEPIAKDNDEALSAWRPLADAFLLHNRDIHARYDDTVVQIGKSAADCRIDRIIKNPNPQSAIRNPNSSVEHPVSKHPVPPPRPGTRRFRSGCRSGAADLRGGPSAEEHLHPDPR
jgi:hydrogenase maturation factor HypF (carbamoyltransferase family)